MTLREKHQQGKFTITVELDPPKSSSAQKVFDQAARLKGKVDAINIADSPMSKNAHEPNFSFLFVATQQRDRNNFPPYLPRS